MTNVVTVTQARDNLAEISGKVKFAEEIVTIEKKGKPYAVIMSPKKYEQYKEMAKKAFMVTVRKIQAKNAGVTEEEVMKDITQAVDEVQKELYAKAK